jgi:hypothetical protein
MTDRELRVTVNAIVNTAHAALVRLADDHSDEFVYRLARGIDTSHWIYSDSLDRHAREVREYEYECDE